MCEKFSGAMTMAGLAAAAVISVSIGPTAAQAQATSATAAALKTPWGEPDLRGIWTDEFDTPLQRPAR